MDEIDTELLIKELKVIQDVVAAATECLADMTGTGIPMPKNYLKDLQRHDPGIVVSVLFGVFLGLLAGSGVEPHQYIQELGKNAASLLVELEMKDQ